jgi:hypothetical protein
LVDDVEVPVCYIVNPALTGERIQQVSTYLGVTPVSCALISEATHLELAKQFATVILRVEPEAAQETALQLWSEHGHRSLLVGEANLIAAVYQDGRKEEIEC